MKQNINLDYEMTDKMLTQLKDEDKFFLISIMEEIINKRDFICDKSL